MTCYGDSAHPLGSGKLKLGKMWGTIKSKFLLVLLLITVSKLSFSQSGNCDATTPFFEADLSSDPNMYWESSAAIRVDKCCGSGGSDRCIEFEVTLHPNTVAIQFDVASGAMPSGALFFQIDCGPQQPVGTPVCVSGVGPHTITFCKPGKNLNTYSVQGFEAPNPIPDVAVADGCQVGLKVNGLVQSSITWRDITGGGVYDSYLDCTSGCDTVTATPTTGYPSYVDYEVSGDVAAGPCSPLTSFTDTVRVNFYPPIDATVTPDPATFCSTSAGVELTANGVGGVPPLTYRWTDAPAGGGTLLGNNQTYTATSAGTFYVEIRDAMYPNCPAQFGDADVSVVLPDDVVAGADQTICESTTKASISGTIVSGTAAYWSGNGTFGDINSLNTTYEPTTAERDAGLATVMLISSGNVTCPPDTDYLSITIVPDVELTLSGDDLVCFGETGVVNSLVSGGSGSYNYAWSSGETTANIAGKVPGSYNLTVTETSVAGCNASASFTINENPEIIASGISNDVNSCQPTTNIISSVSGGDGSFTYAWSNGETTADVTVGAGSYTLNVTDGNSCPASFSTTVNLAVVDLNVTISPVAMVCFGETTSVTATANGGVGTYVYSWTSGESANLINKGAGTYKVIVTDDWSCVDSAEITVTEVPELTSSISVNNVLCNGGTGDATIATSGGTGTITYLWDNGQTTATATSLLAGDYSVTATDANGCTTSQSITITEPTELTSSISTNNVLCNGGTGDATIVTSGGTGTITYLWDNGQTTATATSLLAGDYSVTATDANGCTKSQSITITEPTELTSSISGNNVLCNGGTGDATIAASGGTGTITYLWDNGQTTATATSLLAGDYSVTATDANGCTTSQSITITEPIELTSSISANNVLCNGGMGDATITTSGGTGTITYLWDNGQTTATATSLLAGDYSVTATDANGCTTDQSLTITEPTALNLTITGNNPVCYQGEGSASIGVSGGTSGYAYLWNNGTTSSINNNLVAGNYSVTVTDANGCEATESVDLVEPDSIEINISVNNVLCNGGEGSAEVTLPTGSGYSYNWSDGQTSRIATNLLAGDYTVTVSNALGCSNISAITVTEPTEYTSSLASNNALCYAGEGDATITTSGGTGVSTYLWDNGQTTATATGLLAGDYSVVATDANGCETSQSVTITQPSDLSLAFDLTHPNCNGSTGAAEVAVTGGTGSYRYSWSNGTIESLAAGLLAGSYEVTVTDYNGCSKDSLITLVEPDVLDLSTAVNDVTCYSGNDGTVKVTATGGTLPYTYLWGNGAVLDSITDLTIGSYSVMVTDSKGCEKEISASISQPSQLTVNNEITNVSCNGGADGRIKLITSGGTGVHNVIWADGATGFDRDALIAGSYDALVSDENGCEINITYTVTEPSTLNGFINSNPVSCYGGNDGSLVANVSGGTTPYTYLWSNGETTSTTSVLTAGDYSLIIKDANDCELVLNSGVVEPSPLVGTITPQDVSCFGGDNGSLTISLSGGTPPYEYNWSDGSTGDAISTLKIGVYSANCNDSKGCKIDLSEEIISPEPLSVGTITDPTYCGLPLGMAIADVISGGVPPYQYEWEVASAKVLSDTAKNLYEGAYEVSVIDGNGCETKQLADVKDVSVGGFTTVAVRNVSCYGGKDGIAEVAYAGSAVPPFNYKWEDVETGIVHYIDVPIAIGLTASRYVAKMTDKNGCEFVSDTIEITQPDPLSINEEVKDLLCYGVCEGEIDLNVSGGTAPYNFNWAQPGLPNSQKIENLCYGRYSVEVVDANGCDIVDFFDINTPDRLEVATSSTTEHCNLSDGTVMASATGGTSPYSYSWNTGAITDSVKNQSAGDYTVEVTDENGCKVDGEIKLETTIPPTMEVVLLEDALCNGDCNGKAQVDLNGAIGGVSFEWSNSSINNPVQSNLCAGDYSVVAIDEKGCKDSVEITITEPEVLTLDLISKDPLCNNSVDGLVASYVDGGTLPYTYSWKDNVNTEITSNDSLLKVGSGDYSLTVTDSNSCSIKETVPLRNPSPIAFKINSTDVACFEACNGSAELEMLSGEGTMSYSWSNGGMTSTINSLCEGDYKVLVTNSNGCSKQDSITIGQPDSLSIELVNQENVKCYGDSNGSLEVAINGGSGIYSVLWSNGATTTSNNGLIAGNYTVEVTDSKGCTTSRTYVIAQPLLLEGVLSTTDVSCYDACNGSASFNITGGVLPYAYEWKGSLSDSSIAINLCNDSFSVKVQDANGCEVSDSFIITQPKALVVAAELSDANCGKNNGEICVSAAGGTGDFVYNWSNGASTNCNKNILAGCFDVRIEDENSCGLDTSFCINDISGPEISIVDSVDILCFGGDNGAVEFAVTDGDGDISTKFFNTTNEFAVVDGKVTGLQAGCYSIEVTDAAGCKASESVCLNEPELLNINTSVIANVSCFGLGDGAAEAHAFGGVAPYVYEWSNGEVSDSVDNLFVGKATVIVSDSNNCKEEGEVVIAQPDSLIASISDYKDLSCWESCDGEATVSAVGGTKPYVYNWSNKDSSFKTSGLCEGIYSVTITDNNGCVDSAVQSIAQPDSLTLSYVAQEAICGACNGTATVKAEGGTGLYSYNWFGIGSAPAKDFNQNLCPDTFNVAVADENGCSKNIDVVVTAAIRPVIDSLIPENAKCFDSFDGNIEAFVSGVGPFSYDWTGSETPSDSGKLEGIGVGSYCLVVTDSNGCKAAECIELSTPTPVETNFTAETSMCYGNSNQVWLNAEGGVPGYTFNWVDSVFDGAGPHDLDAYEEKEYCFTATDSNGCKTEPMCFNTTISKPLFINTDKDIMICEDQTALLRAYAGGGSGSPYSVNVYANSPYTGELMTSTLNTNIVELTANPDTTTTYYFVLSDGCSEEVFDSLNVMVNFIPDVELTPNDSSGCVPFTMPFKIETNIEGATFEFDFDGDGVIDYVGLENEIEHTFTEAGIFKAKAYVISPDSCKTRTEAETFIIVYEVPTIDFTIKDLENLSLGNNQAKFIANYEHGNYFKWNFGDGDSIQGFEDDYIYESEYTTHKYEMPYHMYQDTGWFNVSVELTARSGCSASYSLPVYVQPSWQFIAPNAFTPNGDGINETFIPVGIGWQYDNYSFSVWNRWGEMIFQSSNQGEPWDGTYNNNQVQSDTYVWKIEFRDIVDNKKHLFTGHINLIR